MGVGGSPGPLLTPEGLGETGGFRDLRASIHSHVSASVRSGASETGLRLRITPPFCCGLLLVSTPVVMVTTVVGVVVAGASVESGGFGLLLRVAVPSVISDVEERTVERGRGSGRCC